MQTVIKLAIVVFTLSACSIYPKTNHKKIVYHVFDSLEREISSEINANLPLKPVGVLLDVVDERIQYQLYYVHFKQKNYDSIFAYLNSGGTLYALSLAYDKYKPHLYAPYFTASNRYLSIDGKLYPISIYDDDAKLSTVNYKSYYSSKNNADGFSFGLLRHSNDSTRKYFVNMATHKFVKL